MYKILTKHNKESYLLYARLEIYTFTLQKLR